MKNQKVIKILYLVMCAMIFLLPLGVASIRNYAPGAAIVLGVLFTLFWGNPFAEKTGHLTHTLLAWAIVGMGFGMNLIAVLKAGGGGIIYTVIGITMGLSLGILFGKKLKLGEDATLLISAGTSICGGSAIAAVAPVLKAKAGDVAMATATVFLLNAVALLIFPPIGRALGFNEVQFGYFAALAIHDTSSVVGASMQYGPTALEVGTTVKLARALWIVPVALFVSFYIGAKRGDGKKVKIKVPWFIPGFLIAAALVTWVPALQSTGGVLKELSKYLMILTLFIIGTNISKDKIKELGIKPILHGVILWIILSTVWATAIYTGIVHCVK